MKEIVFTIKESEDGGFEAQALGYSIFTEAETIELLKDAIKESVICHFEKNAPKRIKLHFIKEETLVV